MQPGGPPEGYDHVPIHIGKHGLAGCSGRTSRGDSDSTCPQPGVKPRSGLHWWRTGAVQTDEAGTGSLLFDQDVGQVWRMVGNHVEGLVGVAVGTGPGQAVVTGQATDGCRITRPPSEHHRLAPAGRGTLPGTAVMGAAMGTKPRRDTAHDGFGQVEDGTVRQHAGTASGRAWDRGRNRSCTTRPACSHSGPVSPLARSSTLKTYDTVW